MEFRRIVDSMSPQEILDLYKQEAPFVSHRLSEFNEKVKKSLYNNRSDIYFFEPLEYKRKSGLNIVIQYFDKGNTYQMSKRLGVFFYYWFHYRNGIYAIRPILDPKYGILSYFYTSHFLQRYIERELKDKSISTKEAMNIFLRNNPKTVMKYKPSLEHPSNGWMCRNQGLCFIEVKPSNIIVMKTFLSWNDLSSVKKTGSSDLIMEAIEKGMDFPVPDNLLDEGDILAE